ncbi:uncharacterized protein ARMOST_21465 [Armillaria ostoyae]|uniref:Uncharacterized protein n=1 Tax=Armillaria ostoyae TaxID=47428 RepID=A0A284SA53_ARMOS|nr:uncharacterized protein ARMOST_21465 [Armillaria ostoyae]
MVQKPHGQLEEMNTDVHPYATCQFEPGKIADTSTLAELPHPEPSSLMECCFLTRYCIRCPSREFFMAPLPRLPVTMRLLYCFFIRPAPSAPDKALLD